MTAQFTTLESGVAACILDGMTQKEAAHALNRTATTVGQIERRMRERFHLKSRTLLAFELRDVARGEG